MWGDVERETREFNSELSDMCYTMRCFVVFDLSHVGNIPAAHGQARGLTV